MDKRRTVIRSLEDDGGHRCIDLLRGAGGFGWVECRRDPEDSHGWRRLGQESNGFATEAAALRDAAAHVGWLEA